MHWATPNTSGRMLDLEQNSENEPISLHPSPVKDDEEQSIKRLILYLIQGGPWQTEIYLLTSIKYKIARQNHMSFFFAYFRNLDHCL